MNKKSIVGMLDIVAKESPDPSTKVGCLLTDEVDRIVIAGYNPHLAYVAASRAS